MTALNGLYAYCSNPDEWASAEAQLHAQLLKKYTVVTVAVPLVPVLRSSAAPINSTPCSASRPPSRSRRLPPAPACGMSAAGPNRSRVPVLVYT